MKYGMAKDPVLRSIKAGHVPYNRAPAMHDVTFQWSVDDTPVKPAYSGHATDSDADDEDESIRTHTFGAASTGQTAGRKGAAVRGRTAKTAGAAGKRRKPNAPEVVLVEHPQYIADPPSGSPPEVWVESKHQPSKRETTGPIAAAAVPRQSGLPAAASVPPTLTGKAVVAVPPTRRGRRPTTNSTQTFVCPETDCGARYRGASGLYYHLRTKHPLYNIRESGVRKHREQA
jgi:hypothetical protein